MLSASLICTTKFLVENENYFKNGDDLESDLQMELGMSTGLPEEPQYRSSTATYVQVHIIYN